MMIDVNALVKAGLRREVALFAAAMERKLQENAHKGGWKNDAPHLLMARVLDEAKEVLECLMPAKQAAQRFYFAGRLITYATHELRAFGPFLKTGALEDVLDEAADVANMLMMVVDVLGALEGT